jgi:hypothetical protein
MTRTNGDGPRANSALGSAKQLGSTRKTLERKHMQPTNLNETSNYQSNIRAEDGLQEAGRRNSLYEGVLIPLGSLFVVLLTVLGAMLIRR